MQWFVIYIKSSSGKSLSGTLSKKKIENFFPTIRVVNEWEDKKKIIEKPLFDSYIFIRSNENIITGLKKYSAIINFVYWLGKPVFISDTEIMNMKRFLHDHINVSVQKVNIGYEENETYKNSVVEKEGLLRKINRQSSIVLPSLGYRITSEIETSNVRILTPENLIYRSENSVRALK